MEKNWKIRNNSEFTGVDSLSDKYPMIIRKLLSARGIHQDSDADKFFNVRYEDLLDPFLFSDMEKAVDRVLLAGEKKEKILIYADYDADAITALSVMILGLKKLGIPADYYIPNRFTEGYGLNLEAVKKLIADKYSLIITVDCGINAQEEALEFKNFGVDFIITDHHELTGELPEAFAIINPKNPKDQYPYSYLTGVGVAYKFIQALFLRIKNLESRGQVIDGWEKWLLDLVAIGTVADCQNLIGENRILVHYGLKVLAKTAWPGLEKLLELAGFVGDKKIDTYTLGFVIAPRINAAGRITHAESSFKLLTAQSGEQAIIYAEELNNLNLKRQMMTEQVLSEAREQAENFSSEKIIIVTGKDWPKGVIGLVAGKLTEEYGKPTLAIEVSDGKASGSARSIDQYNIVEALEFCKDILVKFGGHHQAAGFSLLAENLPLFNQKIRQHANQALVDSSLLPVVYYDSEITDEILDFALITELERFEPFGVGNPPPRFIARNIELLSFSTVGNLAKHLRLYVKFGKKNFSAIAFNRGYFVKNLNNAQKLDLLFEPSLNQFNGNKEIQLKIIDLKLNA